MSKIAGRDFFDAPKGERARTELARAEEAFAAFEVAALAAEEPAVPPEISKPSRPRAVKDS